MAICGEDMFAAGKSADERKQRGLGQMKIREELIDDAEWFAGKQEDFGFRAASRN